MGALLAALANQASGFLGAGAVPERMGNRHPSIAPYESFAAADGEIVVAVGNDRQFQSLCAELGAPQLAPIRASPPTRCASRIARSSLRRSHRCFARSRGRRSRVPSAGRRAVRAGQRRR